VKANAPQPRDGLVIGLIGLRASGKSTVAGLLATQLGTRRGERVRCVDLDDRTAAVLKCGSCGEALRTLGEAAFRAGEAVALRAVLDELKGGAGVLALGGGTAMFPDARALIEERARAGALRLVYLHARSAVLKDRLLGTDLSTRPSLTGAGVVDEVDALYAARDPVYRSLAEKWGAVVEVERLSPSDVVERIAAALTLWDRH
jgi:shikimate kinase